MSSHTALRKKAPHVHVLYVWMAASETHPACTVSETTCNYLKGNIRWHTKLSPVQWTSELVSMYHWQANMCKDCPGVSQHWPRCSVIIMIMIIIIALKGTSQDFLQSPHCAMNCLQHVRSSGQGAIVCKSRNTSSACHAQHVLCATWYKGTAQLLSLTELKLLVFELYLIGWTIYQFHDKAGDSHHLKGWFDMRLTPVSRVNTWCEYRITQMCHRDSLPPW